MIRLTTILRESENIDSTIEKIKRATQLNDHTRSVEILAKLLNDNKAVKLLKAIDDINSIEGSMPKHVEQYRTEIRLELLKKAASKFGNDVRAKLHSAF